MSDLVGLLWSVLVFVVTFVLPLALLFLGGFVVYRLLGNTFNAVAAFITRSWASVRQGAHELLDLLQDALREIREALLRVVLRLGNALRRFVVSEASQRRRRTLFRVSANEALRAARSRR